MEENFISPTFLKSRVTFKSRLKKINFLLFIVHIVEKMMTNYGIRNIYPPPFIIWPIELESFKKSFLLPVFYV